MSRYAIGIDLGTTNSVVAATALDDRRSPRIDLLPIPQMVAVNTVESRSNLPSFLYRPPAHEQSGGPSALPWTPTHSDIVGEFARQQSAVAPERSVATAKSWLAHSAVDRRAPILPWDAPDEVPKISPVMAAQRYLEHLIAAWDQAHPDAPLGEQSVVLTVPASFDASARELTREAAIAAGMPPNFVLLEEPQAAVYSWLDEQFDTWRERLAVGDRLLVCDVGGGTTDLTLIGAADEAGSLQLQRLAVGRHLLVGGDNMDLALAHYAAELLRDQGVELDAWQSVSLWHACRIAKEVLLSDEGPESHSVSVLGRGSRLIGGTVTVPLQRQAVLDRVVEGFFPVCSLDDRPARRRQSGFVELGLPFEADTAITRHVASFLSDQMAADDGSPPTHVLFNGGVFRASPLRQRMLEVLRAWFPGAEIGELGGRRDLEYAVARGAAYYGWAKQHGGVRIRGGTARSYYIGIETTGLAIPGAARPMKALCVVPFGMEEGTEIDVPSAEIGLVLGEPAQFRFFSSVVRQHDQPGQLLDRWSEDELQETDSLETCLTASGVDQETYVPVRFQSRVTELGVLELWCVSTRSGERWKLEFNVREPAGR